MRGFFVAVLTVVGLLSPLQAQDAEQPVYELRIYTCEPGKLDALHTRFRDHTMEIFARHGMKNVAYWNPTDGDEAETTLIYLLEHKSRDAAKASWDAFRNDPEWKQVAADSKEQHGKILAKSPESIYMETTDYSPQVMLPKAGKTYELRIYPTNEGKLAALHSRFRDHTVALFAKHGLASYAYWAPLDEPRSANEMIYVLETPDRDSAKASWKAFGQDPDWRAAYAESTQGGKLVAGRPTSIYMKLTDFSPHQ